MSTTHFTQKSHIILIWFLFSAFFFFPLVECYSNDDKPGDKAIKSEEGIDISYSIEPFYDVNSFKLIVQLEFKGEQSGATKLILPNVFGGQNHYESIKSIKAETPNTFIENSPQGNVKIVKYIPFSRVRISYRVEEIRKGIFGLGNQYQSILNKNYMYFLGETFFVIPNWNWNQQLNFKIEWKHFPANWNMSNSFGVNQRIQETKTSLSSWMKSVFTGGDFRIIKRYVNGSPLYVSIRGDWMFSDNEFGDICASIMKAERDFWNDNEYPFFLFTILQVDGSRTQTGISRSNSISLYLSPDCFIDYGLKRLLAHELFHRWIGDRMNFSDPIELLYWFREGFSEYYARLLLLRAKLITLSEYTDSYNEVLDNYFSSSVRYEKNEALAGDLTDNPELAQMPFLRGDIIAHNLNLIIRKSSNWSKSLDDLMRDLYDRCTNEKLIVSNGSLSAMIRYYAGEQTLVDIMRVLNSGAVLKTMSSVLGSCFKMQIESRRKFWLIGESYEIPRYEPADGGNSGDKKCLDWFGVN